jgi:hypothetical protein
MKLYAPDVEAVQAANPTASPEELLKLFKQCRREIPEGEELWARMVAVMEKFTAVGPDAEGNVLFNGPPDTVEVFMNQRDMVLAGAVTGEHHLHALLGNIVVAKLSAARCLVCSTYFPVAPSCSPHLTWCSSRPRFILFVLRAWARPRPLDLLVQ